MALGESLLAAPGCRPPIGLPVINDHTCVKYREAMQCRTVPLTLPPLLKWKPYALTWLAVVLRLCSQVCEVHVGFSSIDEGVGI